MLDSEFFRQRKEDGRSEFFFCGLSSLVFSEDTLSLPLFSLSLSLTKLLGGGRGRGHRKGLGGRDGDVIETDVASLDGLAREIAGYGPDVLVLEPDSLRSDVVARLTAQAGVRA